MPSQFILIKYGADTGRSNNPDLARSGDLARTGGLLERPVSAPYLIKMNWDGMATVPHTSKDLLPQFPSLRRNTAGGGKSPTFTSNRTGVLTVMATRNIRCAHHRDGMATVPYNRYIEATCHGRLSTTPIYGIIGIIHLKSGRQQ